MGYLTLMAGSLWVFIALSSRQQRLPRQPDIGQSEWYHQFGGVFHQTILARLDMPELLLDYPERMFYFGVGLGFDRFSNSVSR